MVGVDYKSCPDDDEYNTYEIFDNMEEAVNFANDIENKDYKAKTKIFVADFSKSRIYKENKGWNYDDVSDTYYNRTDIRV